MRCEMPREYIRIKERERESTSGPKMENFYTVMLHFFQTPSV